MRRSLPLVRLLLAAVLGALLAACGAQQETASAPSSAPSAASSAPSAAPSRSASPSAAAAPSAAATITPGPGEFVNPVINRDFPDPDTIKVGESYYAYATNSGSVNVQVARSEDLVTWEQLPDALPTLPAWTRPGLTWAPEVTTSADGQSYLLYFTARDTASDKQCIGVATSATPEGPFSSAAETPLICQTDQGGSIDAASFADEDGARYLLWKNDGNCCGFTTYLYLQRVSADGLGLEGEPAQLISNDQVWEGNLVEAPTLWKHDGKYYLFYSANNYAGLNYAVGYAVADQITGPYQKPGRPLLATDMQAGAAFGPGGQDVIVDDDGETWLMYHSWDLTITYRGVQLDELVWEGDTPVVQGPDRGPQAAP